MKPLSSEEQQAALGNIYRKPKQIDLLTGEESIKPPKAGHGDHIRLKSDGPDRRVVPGMAHFAGTGPKGKRCSDCRYLSDLSRKIKGGRTVLVKNACEKAEEITGHVGAGGIQHEAACKYFKR